MKKIILSAVLLLLVGGASIYLLMKPSNSRDWTVDQAVLPTAEFDGDTVTIRNIRDFEYRTKDDYDIRYYDKTINVADIDSLWYVLSLFDTWDGPAHSFLSFGFSDGSYLAVSVEIRKEKGEVFSPYKGLFNQYEVMYVVADEHDVVKLRTNYRENERVYVYPVKTTPERAQQIFVEMLQRANKLAKEPEFYNTVTNNCTSNIVRHVNSIVPGRVPSFAYQMVLPGYSDRLAHRLGLIDTDLPWEQVRPYYHVNNRARLLESATSQEFSTGIRNFVQ